MESDKPQSASLKAYLALETIMLEARASGDAVAEDRILDSMDTLGRWLSDAENNYLISRGHMPEVMLQKIEFPDEKGGLTLAARSPAFAALVHECAKLFREEKGVNYCEWTMNSPDPAFGMFTVMIQRKAGITAAEKASKYKAALSYIADGGKLNPIEVAQKALNETG